MVICCLEKRNFFNQLIDPEIFIKRSGASTTNSVIDPTFLAGDLYLIF